MKEVKRLTWDACDEHACRCDIVESSDGDMVNYEDYAALKAERDVLAAENARLRSAMEFATAPDMWVEQADGMLDYRYSEWYVDALNEAMNTPATDAAIAEIHARALPGEIAEIIDSGELESILFAFEASYSEQYRMALYNFRMHRAQLRKEEAQ